MNLKLCLPGRGPALVLVFLLGCRPPESRGPAPAPPLRTSGGWYSSPRELAEMVLLGLREKDEELLDSLRVTEREYQEVLFPEFPAAAGNAPPEFHWFLTNTHSRAGIESALGNWGGKDFELVDVVVTQETQDYRTFRILNKVELKVKDRKGGPEIRQLRIFGSMVELKGRYKILSFRN